MIPGARTIEKILAALPTNASQSIQIQKLAEQLVAAELKLAEQAQKIAELEGAIKRIEDISSLNPDALRILKHMFDHPSRYSANGIHGNVGLSESIVEFHFDRLKVLGLIESETALNRYGFENTAVQITSEGRAFIMRHFKA
jgi:DNA-binding Lrp family transcriptional regulator